MKKCSYKKGVLSWDGKLISIFSISHSEIWSDIRGDLWWEWPYKKGTTEKKWPILESYMLFIWLFLQVMVTCIFWQNTNFDIVKKYLARNKHNWKKKKIIKDFKNSWWKVVINYFKLFGFLIFWLWAYLMKVIQEKCRTIN
jgi:hypothetical protein